MKLKAFLLTQLRRPFIRRAAHTAWQSALGVLLAGIFAAHSTGDVKALVIAAFAAAASAVKSLVVAQLEARG